VAEPHAELLRALHDAHGPALFRYVVRLTGDYGFAQDVVQETMLRAWKRPALLDRDEDAARAWLFTVAATSSSTTGEAPGTPARSRPTTCRKRLRRTPPKPSWIAGW